MFKLEICDVLLHVNEGTDWTSAISRWGAGRFGHVSMYIGKAWGVPFIFESDGRGVVLQSLQHKTGELVKVMRHTVFPSPEHELVTEAISLASSDRAYYDYFTIVRSCIPRALKMKFPWLPIPVKYHRDPMMICSEAVAEVFWRAGIEVLSKDIVPLPIDFETSPILEPVYEGRLLEDITT